MKKEEKIKKFKELATKRTNNLLRQTRILGNLSNKSAYEYTKEDINKIFSEIENSLKETRSKFHFPKDKEFKL